LIFTVLNPDRQGNRYFFSGSKSAFEKPEPDYEKIHADLGDLLFAGGTGGFCQQAHHRLIH